MSGRLYRCDPWRRGWNGSSRNPLFRLGKKNAALWLRRTSDNSAPSFAAWEVRKVVECPRSSPALETAQILQFKIVEFQDRKSTRLNSSHQIISYAVFCLKKKK